MQINLNKNQKKFCPKIKKFIFIFVFLSFIFFSLNFTGYSRNLKEFFFLISSPVQKVLWQAGENISNFFAGILEAKILKKELSSLYFKHQKTLGQLAALAELKKENETLRKALNLGLEKEFQLMLVRTTSKDISQDAILINKGKRDGILENYPVITQQKILLGRVGQVYDRFSEVILISNKESSFDAKVIVLFSDEVESEKVDDLNHSWTKDNEVYGMIKGGENLKLYLDLISRENEISEGQSVITSLLGGVYPEGLLVGKIKSVGKSDIESFQKAEIEPFFKMGNLDYLFVITEF